MNTTQYSPQIGPPYATGASLNTSESSTQTASRSFQQFFSGLARWQTDWQTDRPRYLVSNNRRSAQWRSQILLLSTATTSIFWSCRLDRSDQLQQSATIISCKIRWVAVYVETQCNVASKRAFPTGVLDRWHNCLLIYWHTSCIRRYLVSRACDWAVNVCSSVCLSVCLP